MPNQIADATQDGKRVTVHFSAADWRRILKEQRKASRELGYAVTISDVIRSIVSNGLGGKG